MGLRGWSNDFPQDHNESEMADYGHIEFLKMLISPYWMKVIVDPLAKFKQCSFIYSRNIERGFKF